MPQVTVIPFRWYHVKQMDLRPQERALLDATPDYLERSKLYEKMGPCFSAVVEGKGIACSWGFIPFWPEVYECWMITSTILDSHPIATIRKAQALVDLTASELKARRLQMTVKAGEALSLRFASALKFEREGVLTAYGPDGSDYIMLARIDHGWTVRRREAGQQRAGGDAAAAARPAKEAAGKARRSTA
jgi:hypothetical protein